MRNVRWLTAFLALLYPAVGDAGETISNNGFSLTFSDNWKVHHISRGVVSAATIPDAPVDASASIFYTVLPAHASVHEIKQFRQSQKNLFSVRNYVDEEQLQKSKWHSKIRTVKLADNLNVEVVDVETLHPSPHINKLTPVCKFYRQYHAPHADLHLIYAIRGKCADKRPEFEEFVSHILWNGITASKSQEINPLK